MKRYFADETQFDELLYTYPVDGNGKLINNKLNWVEDYVPSANYLAPDDFDIKPGQATNNYVYDAIGNLILDKQEHLQITWNNFGKVSKIEKLNSANTQVLSTTSYFYDAAGNRVKKSDQNSGSTFPGKQEYYIRDASGNPLTQYVRNNSSTLDGSLTTTEQTIYGIDRLGVHVSGVELNTTNGVFVKVSSTPTDNLYRVLNNKRYELKDHLGNVRSIFTDVRLATISGTQSSGYTFSNSHAEATAMYNYFAFGSPKPNIYDLDINNNVTTIAYTENYDNEKPTTVMASSGFKYRFGFNGQEKDNEIKGTGNSIEFKFRIYDARLGRFLSIDPLTKSYPWYTPYQFAGNTPIMAKDLEGLEPLSMITCNGKLTKPMVSLLNSAFLLTKSSLQNATWQPYYANGQTRRWALLVGIPGSTNASVCGKTVVHDDDRSRTEDDWFGMIVHEQTHEWHMEGQQWTFYGNYAIEGMTKDYGEITTEKLAFINGSSYGGDDYASRFLKYKDGVVLKTLNNFDMSENEQSKILESVGARFRRDVIIPDLISQNNKAIYETEKELYENKSLSEEQRTFYIQSLGALEQRNAELKKESGTITTKYGN